MKKYVLLTGIVILAFLYWDVVYYPSSICAVDEIIINEDNARVFSNLYPGSFRNYTLWQLVTWLCTGMTRSHDVSFYKTDYGFRYLHDRFCGTANRCAHSSAEREWVLCTHLIRVPISSLRERMYTDLKIMDGFVLSRRENPVS